MEKSDIIFQLNHITQEFPGVKALDDVSFFGKERKNSCTGW